MSGGVDSSLSAALLVEEGFDVVGVFIRAWEPDFLKCNWADERRDAMRIASLLGIQFETFDLSKEYKKEVIDTMIAEYKSGRTPNPDVLCNKKIKFGIFFDKAIEAGADFVATGHYAQVKKDEEIYRLHAGKDKKKDQSYFLWTLTQKILSRTLFPIGDIEKTKVREEAAKRGLPVATKKDSQGLCFVGKLDFKEFLKRYVDVKKGSVLNADGEIIGEHDGVQLYTLGERHGFTITKKTPNDAPYYIIGKDIKKNEITVANEDGIVEFSEKEIRLSNTNWISDIPKKKYTYQARIRYRQLIQECVIEEISNNKATINFKDPQKAATSGQSLVLYDGEICLGGGVIKGLDK